MASNINALSVIHDFSFILWTFPHNAPTLPIAIESLVLKASL